MPDFSSVCFSNAVVRKQRQDILKKLVRKDQMSLNIFSLLSKIFQLNNNSFKSLMWFNSQNIGFCFHWNSQVSLPYCHRAHNSTLTVFNCNLNCSHLLSWMLFLCSQSAMRSTGKQKPRFGVVCKHSVLFDLCLFIFNHSRYVSYQTPHVSIFSGSLCQGCQYSWMPACSTHFPIQYHLSILIATKRNSVNLTCKTNLTIILEIWHP